MFHPSGLWENLGEFFLGHATYVSFGVDEEGPGTGGALVEGDEVFVFHGKKIGFKPVRFLQGVQDKKGEGKEAFQYVFKIKKTQTARSRQSAFFIIPYRKIGLLFFPNRSRFDFADTGHATRRRFYFFILGENKLSVRIDFVFHGLRIRHGGGSHTIEFVFEK